MVERPGQSKQKIDGEVRRRHYEEPLDESSRTSDRKDPTNTHILSIYLGKSAMDTRRHEVRWRSINIKSASGQLRHSNFQLNDIDNANLGGRSGDRNTAL